MAATHDLPLMSTMAVGLSLAFICGMVATKLRIPPIVGFLLAGFIIGPYSPGFVADQKIAEELSEIGIVLLMFGVGLHFSLNDLLAVRKISLPGAVVQIAAAMILAMGLAMMWGWNIQNGIIFGLSLSVASTVVLLRTLEEKGITQTVNGQIAIGWLIVEDLVIILSLVLIPTLAAQNLEGAAAAASSPAYELILAIAKVGLFIGIMLVFGRKALPKLLSIVAKTRSREMFTLAVFALAMGIAFIAAKLFGVSFALGAFFAGMMIRESKFNHEVADRALPFQEAFAVLFFVAVGMLFNPSVIFAEPLNVLAVVAIIIVGKSLAAFAIITFFGYPLKTALIVSAGLAQIGEFSFVLISMGLMYGILPPEGRDLILAGAIISIALNPLVFKFSEYLNRAISNNPKLARYFIIDTHKLEKMEVAEKASLKELVILVGYGRVGRYICQNIRDVYDLVVVDMKPEIVEHLREKGFHAIAGDATLPETLHEAAIDKAVAIIVAVPDSFEVLRITQNARQIMPEIKILVRAQREEELEALERENIDLALCGTTEVGKRMVGYLTELRAAA